MFVKHICEQCREDRVKDDPRFLGWDEYDDRDWSRGVVHCKEIDKHLYIRRDKPPRQCKHRKEHREAYLRHCKRDFVHAIRELTRHLSPEDKEVVKRWKKELRAKGK